MNYDKIIKIYKKYSLVWLRINRVKNHKNSLLKAQKGICRFLDKE